MTDTAPEETTETVPAAEDTVHFGSDYRPPEEPPAPVVVDTPATESEIEPGPEAPVPAAPRASRSAIHAALDSLLDSYGL
jgi:hypothetical protein